MGKTVVERLAAIQGHELRREILQVAREEHAMGKLVSPVGLHRRLKKPIGSVSYHVKVLCEEGALELFETIPRRGAGEHCYAINEAFLAEIQDSMALDQIAELIESHPAGEAGNANTARWETLKDSLTAIVRATGRPVEA